ncbi:MAG: GPR endopeptidase [Clostridia bacterium]|nr:GPR endopeptidase [Clostridia bacterium]
MNNRIYSDLALESSYALRGNIKKAGEYSETERNGIKICRLDISSQALAEKYRRSRGIYITAICGKIWLFSEQELENTAMAVGEELRAMITELCGCKISKDFSVLVAGLGNAEITPDAIGPRTVSRLTVTRHIPRISEKIFNDLGQCTVSAIAPGVLAQTGIETLELIRGAVSSTSPDIVIAIDALAARSCERLAATVQISDSGISPGSGIGNLRKAINRENIGVPVIALGVPTVVDSATLVYDALERAGIECIEEKLRNVLDNDKGFFVSPKESDVIADSVSLLIAKAIDFALRADSLR